MSRTYQRGDMYYADLGRGIGSEQEGYRPVVIIQNNIGNKHSSTVIIAAISSRVGAKPKLPTHYYINAEDGLELPAIILLEQIRTIDKRQLSTYIGRLSEKHLNGMNHALAVSIDLINPVLQKLSLCYAALVLMLFAARVLLLCNKPLHHRLKIGYMPIVAKVWAKFTK